MNANVVMEVEEDLEEFSGTQPGTRDLMTVSIVYISILFFYHLMLACSYYLTVNQSQLNIWID